MTTKYYCDWAWYIDTARLEIKKPQTTDITLLQQHTTNKYGYFMFWFLATNFSAKNQTIILSAKTPRFWTAEQQQDS